MKRSTALITIFTLLAMVTFAGIFEVAVADDLPGVEGTNGSLAGGIFVANTAMFLINTIEVASGKGNPVIGTVGVVTGMAGLFVGLHNHSGGLVALSGIASIAMSTVSFLVWSDNSRDQKPGDERSSDASTLTLYGEGGAQKLGFGISIKF